MKIRWNTEGKLEFNDNGYWALVPFEMPQELPATIPSVSEQTDVGTWLWGHLMDWCKSQKSSPSNYNSLFKIVDAARIAFPIATAGKPAIAEHSPLALHQVIKASDEAKSKVQHFKTEMLKIGHLCQYAHDEEFARASMSCLRTGEFALYDREYGGWLQDDKVATRVSPVGANLVLSKTHTISESERLAWNTELRKSEAHDVVIHSFEVHNEEQSHFKYMGPISWRAIRAHLRENADGANWYFYRDEAYTWSMLPQS